MRFHHFDTGQIRQRGLELLPQPHRQVFAGGVVQPGNIVQIAMVERGMDRPPGRLDVGEIEHPAERGIDLAADGELDPKRMAVQARAGMGVGQRGQPPRALQVEDAEDVHIAFSRKSGALTMQASNDGGLRPRQQASPALKPL